MPNRPGTPPNTSLILTDDELAYINQQFGGGKSAAIHAALGAMMENDIEYQAYARVAADSQLEYHREKIFYDWPNWDDHMRWVATAPVAEIVEWAVGIEAQPE